MNEFAQTPQAPPPPSPSPAPLAWQPVTCRGVAAFSRATLARLLLVELIVAVCVASTVVWCLKTRYAPVISSAIQKLPEDAQLNNGRIEGVPDQSLGESKLFSIVADIGDSGEIGQSADLQIELHREGFRVCSLLRSAFGCLAIPYPQGQTFSLARSRLEPWWGAWLPMLLIAIGAGVVAALLAIWAFLALLYTPIVKFVGYFGDRELPGWSAWRLASAALMPGALLMGVGIVLYGLLIIDLIGLAVIAGVHFLVGWVYVIASTCFVQSTSTEKPSINPFNV